MTISVIAAVASNGVVGRAGHLPWHLSADLKRFKSLTMGKPIIMGRRTHESIGRVLPGRENVVLSRDPDWQAPGCSVRRDWPTVLQEYAAVGECMVIGGAALYRLALPVAAVFYLTRVHTHAEGDVYLPAVDWDAWQEQARDNHLADSNNDHDYSFVVLTRRLSP